MLAPRRLPLGDSEQAAECAERPLERARLVERLRQVAEEDHVDERVGEVAEHEQRRKGAEREPDGEPRREHERGARGEERAPQRRYAVGPPGERPQRARVDGTDEARRQREAVAEGARGDEVADERLPVRDRGGVGCGREEPVGEAAAAAVRAGGVDEVVERAGAENLEVARERVVRRGAGVERGRESVPVAGRAGASVEADLPPRAPALRGSVQPSVPPRRDGERDQQEDRDARGTTLDGSRVSREQDQERGEEADAERDADARQRRVGSGECCEAAVGTGRGSDEARLAVGHVGHGRRYTISSGSASRMKTGRRRP